jgi:hypothetical protein
MTDKEFSRFEIIQKVCDKRITQKTAAENLGICTRQVIRLCKRFRNEGRSGLVSKKRGIKSNNYISDEIKEKALLIIKEKHSDFGPTLAQEKLLELDHLKLSVGTIRNLMIQNSIREVRKVKKKVINQMRERRSKYGELIQIDGSPHDWFEGKSPKYT